MITEETITQKTQLLSRIRKTDNSLYNTILFPDDIKEIDLFGFNVFEGSNKRRYLIELHKCEGFSMIKFYPKIHKNNKRKYELRGAAEIGFTLSKDRKSVV